ncbi:hypothetical protein ACE83Q_06230 [Dellaglioa sp. P0083]|uniref:hypothetical protein n=1 Tax=Dellaglioa kimchii TaxID=3344667 RepID=UPI0038D3877A
MKDAKMMKNVKKIITYAIFVLATYFLFSQVLSVSEIATDRSFMEIAKAEPVIFISIFFIIYSLFMIISIAFFYFSHILLKIKGKYDISLLILNFFTVFLTISTLVIKSVGGALPTVVIKVSLFFILISMSLSTTAKLLALREERLKKRKK